LLVLVLALVLALALLLLMLPGRSHRRLMVRQIVICERLGRLSVIECLLPQWFANAARSNCMRTACTGLKSILSKATVHTHSCRPHYQYTTQLQAAKEAASEGA
jgi:hypothetical protein